MSFWILLEKGHSMPAGKSLGMRFSSWVGRRRAARRKNVQITKSCVISPEARLNARNGRIETGEKCSIAAGAIVQGNVRMGDNCTVQAYSILVGYGGVDDTQGYIRIGNNVRIAPHVMILAGNHAFNDTDRPICEQGLELKPVTIGNDVWIAGRVNITAGVTIGDGCVIGAGAVVTHDIPPYSVAVGVPAKVIKSRRSEQKA